MVADRKTLWTLFGLEEFYVVSCKKRSWEVSLKYMLLPSRKVKNWGKAIEGLCWSLFESAVSVKKSCKLKRA
jgi:hypothetical protein